MKIMSVLAYSIAITLLSPLAWGGSPSDPESTDNTGDAMVGGTYLPALDMTSAWFTTGLRLPVGFNQLPTAKLTIKVADLGAAAPVADAKAEDIRYHYRMDYRENSVAQWVECSISLAAAATGGVPLATKTGLGVGAYCEGPRAASNTDGMSVDIQADSVSIWTISSSGLLMSNIVLTTWSGPATATPGPSYKGTAAVDRAFSADYIV